MNIKKRTGFSDFDRSKETIKSASHRPGINKSVLAEKMGASPVAVKKSGGSIVTANYLKAGIMAEAVAQPQFVIRLSSELLAKVSEVVTMINIKQGAKDITVTRNQTLSYIMECVLEKNMPLALKDMVIAEIEHNRLQGNATTVEINDLPATVADGTLAAVAVVNGKRVNYK
jgi:hypothetical protein